MAVYLENKIITLFGDSIGKGITTDSGRPVVADTDAVKLFEKEYGVKVDNTSVYGNSIKKIVERGIIDKYIEELDRTKLNVAVLEIGGNDADFDWKEVAKTPCDKHESKTSLREFYTLYDQTVLKLLDAGVEVIPCEIVPVMSKRYFDEVISKVSDGDKVLQFFHGDVETIARHQESFNNAIIKTAYSSGLKTLDIRSGFLSITGTGELMCQDGIHPNVKGQHEIFKAIKDFVSK